MSKYQLLRDSMQELNHEASEKGGLNPRAQMILELIADYEAMQQQHTATSTDSEQVTEIEAPSNSLPSWSECNLRVGNSEWLKDNDREAECDSLTANPLHEFIYEYDDSDAYKSAWFLHRLENLIGFIRSEQQPAVARLVDALERIMTWPDSGNRYGQANIKVFAAEALAAYRAQGGDL